MRALSILTFCCLCFGGLVVFADCGTDNPGNNQTVTCDSDDTNGFDGTTNTGLDVTVEQNVTVSRDDGSGAIAVGDDASVTVEQGASVDGNNNGDGIHAQGDADIDIAADATVSGNNGINADGTLTLENNGTITGELDDAVDLGADDNVITNNGTIEAGWGIWGSGTDSNTITNNALIDGTFIGVEVSNNNAITNSGSGTINSESGTAISVNDDNTVLNDGVLTANSTGISAADGNTITNNGEIDANGAGIRLGNNNAVTNSDSITGGSDGLVAGSGNLITNNGTIEGEGSDGVEMDASAIVNIGTIDGAINGVEINGGDGAYIRNEGTIHGGDAGIEDQSFSGDDTILNYGTISSDSGTAIDAGNGDDLVALFEGAKVRGAIDGGSGSDSMVLSFDFGTVSDDEADELTDAIDHAIASTERSGSGRIVIDGQTYRWRNFEELLNFIQYSVRSRSQNVQVIPDRDPRLNYMDAAAPVAIYCEPGNLISVYDIGADGQGSLAFSAPLLDIWAGEGAVGLGNSLVALSQEQVQVIAPASDGSLYTFTFDPNVCATA